MFANATNTVAVIKADEQSLILKRERNAAVRATFQMADSLRKMIKEYDFLLPVDTPCSLQEFVEEVKEFSSDVQTRILLADVDSDYRIFG